MVYELTEYVLERNQEYSQVLIQRDGAGFLSTIYTYGNQRINTESINNLSGIYTYDGRGSVSVIIGGWGDFRATYWYDGLGNVKSQIHGYGAFGSGKRYFGYNAEQYNPVTGNQNLRARQVNIRRQRFLTEDTFIGKKNNPITLNRYIYANDNPLFNKDPDGFAPIYIQNQGNNNNGKEPYIIKQGDEQYFIRNGAEPVYSKNGDNYYITSGNIEVKEIPQPMIGSITSIASPGYKDSSPYAVDDVYHIQNYITNVNPNTRFIAQKENQIGNVTFVAGVGVGITLKSSQFSLEAQARYAGEKDIFYNQEIRGVFNTKLKALGTSISWNEDILNKKRYEENTIYSLSNSRNDIIWTFGTEIYAIFGGGFSGYVNISEIMRRVHNMFNGGCSK